MAELVAALTIGRAMYMTSLRRHHNAEEMTNNGMMKIVMAAQKTKSGLGQPPGAGGKRRKENARRRENIIQIYCPCVSTTDPNCLLRQSWRQRRRLRFGTLRQGGPRGQKHRNRGSATSSRNRVL